MITCIMLVIYPTNLNLQLNLHTRRSFSLLRSVQSHYSQMSFHQLLLQLLRVYTKIKLFGVPSFPDLPILLFQGMFFLSRLNFIFSLFVFIFLRFQCSRCLVSSVSRNVFSVLRSVNYNHNLHFVSAFQFTTFNYQQVSQLTN